MTSMKKIGPLGLGLLVTVVLGLAFSNFLTAKEDEAKTTAFMGVSVNKLIRSEKLDLGLKWGVRVMGVERKSAADKAGIEEEDILLRFNGEKIRQTVDLTEMVAEHKPGEKIELVLMRDKQKKTVNLTLGERKDRPVMDFDEDLRVMKPSGAPPFHHQDLKRPFLGITMEMVEGDYATYFGLKDKTGVVVRNLDEEGPANKAGIKAGDLLVSLGEKKIESIGDVHEALKKMKPAENLEITVIRHGKNQKITVTLGEAKGLQIFRFFNGEGNWMPKGDKNFHQFFFDLDEGGALKELKQNVHSNLDKMKERIRIIRKKVDSKAGLITL